MDWLTADDVNSMIDYATLALYVVCFCLGWTAGSPR